MDRERPKESDRAPVRREVGSDEFPASFSPETCRRIRKPPRPNNVFIHPERHRIRDVSPRTEGEPTNMLRCGQITFAEWTNCDIQWHSLLYKVRQRNLANKLTIGARLPGC